jgi:hypothetical protein
MKKLLALMLVLGITSAANATLYLSVNGNTTVEQYEVESCTTVMIDVYSDNSDPYGCYVGIVDAAGDDCGGAEWTGAYTIYHPGAGGMASVGDEELPNWWFASALGVPPGELVTPGKHFDFEYHCLGAFCDWCYVELWNYDFNEVLDTIAIHQIPEPATMLLLGLGGLLLRRRK